MTIWLISGWNGAPQLTKPCKFCRNHCFFDRENYMGLSETIMNYRVPRFSETHHASEGGESQVRAKRLGSNTWEAWRPRNDAGCCVMGGTYWMLINHDKPLRGAHRDHQAMNLGFWPIRRQNWRKWPTTSHNHDPTLSPRDWDDWSKDHRWIEPWSSGVLQFVELFFYVSFSRNNVERSSHLTYPMLIFWNCNALTKRIGPSHPKNWILRQICQWLRRGSLIWKKWVGSWTTSLP